MKQVSCGNNTKGNVFKLKQDRFGLDTRMKIFMMKVLIARGVD